MTRDPSLSLFYLPRNDWLSLASFTFPPSPPFCHLTPGPVEISVAASRVLKVARGAAAETKMLNLWAGCRVC
ncbi:hypothetical protein MATL_G00201480 [Megalops atlanticus]|uniref:Uncharacterized protein n=1 Tax=Megalops atlanticus TaxID=7932 RepID=A0A9D3PJF4_MEGAT|nr:hypothetical protein MATL_G00201480 [Megalops atlanticus]